MTAEDSPQPELRYPPPPWNMRGDMWISTFRVPNDVNSDRPAGRYTVGFVDYAPGSAMTYRELVVNRQITTGPHTKSTTIPDIWVDSPSSVRGGRDIWAVPKELCVFTCIERTTGPLARTEWSASIGRRPFVQAQFSDLARLAVRLPVPSSTTFQPGLPEGDGPKYGTMQASARFIPCRSTWSFDSDGPLGWLAGAQKVFSARARHFRMEMGVADS